MEVRSRPPRGAECVWAIALVLTGGLLGEGASAEGTTGPPLVDAAKRGDAKVVRTLLSKGADVDARDGEGATALIWAAANDHGAVVQMLLAAGAAVDAKDQKGITGLHEAARKGHGRVVQILLGAGAAVGARRGDGDTPLILAVDNGHLEVVKALIAAGAPVDARHGQSKKPKAMGEVTALMEAARRGHVEITRALIAAGAALEAKDSHGQTALVRAVLPGRTEVVRVLAGAGADLDVRTPSGLTPLMLATTRGHAETAKALVAAGATVNPEGSTGTLEFADQSNYREGVRFYRRICEPKTLRRKVERLLARFPQGWVPLGLRFQTSSRTYQKKASALVPGCTDCTDHFFLATREYARVEGNERVEVRFEHRNGRFDIADVLSSITDDKFARHVQQELAAEGIRVTIFRHQGRWALRMVDQGRVYFYVELGGQAHKPAYASVSARAGSEQLARLFLQQLDVGSMASLAASCQDR